MLLIPEISIAHLGVFVNGSLHRLAVITQAGLSYGKSHFAVSALVILQNINSKVAAVYSKGKTTIVCSIIHIIK